jgi:hypothetical protein
MPTIQKLSKEDYRRYLLMKRPPVIYNQLTNDSFIYLHINQNKKYTLMYNSNENKRYCLYDF